MNCSSAIVAVRRSCLELIHVHIIQPEALARLAVLHDHVEALHLGVICRGDQLDPLQSCTSHGVEHYQRYHSGIYRSNIFIRRIYRNSSESLSQNRVEIVVELRSSWKVLQIFEIVQGPKGL